MIRGHVARVALVLRMRGRTYRRSYALLLIAARRTRSACFRRISSANKTLERAPHLVSLLAARQPVFKVLFVTKTTSKSVIEKRRTFCDDSSSVDPDFGDFHRRGGESAANPVRCVYQHQ